MFDYAVYKEQTVLQFFAGNNSTVSSLYSEVNGKSEINYDVNAVTLKRAIELTGEDSIDLVKMDIEGAEFDVISSISDGVFEKVNAFIIEYHDYLFENGMYDPTSIEDILTRNGYTCTRHDIKGSKFIFAKKN